MADEKKDLPMPHEGGSYIRDPKTGALTKVDDPEPVAPRETGAPARTPRARKEA